MSIEILAPLLGISLIIIGGIWWALASAPTVNESKCIFGDIRERRTSCGGPCRQGKLPCEEE